MPKIKVIRFKQESAHTQMDGHTHTHTDATKYIISPATRSIITVVCVFREVMWQLRSIIYLSCLSTFHFCRLRMVSSPSDPIALELLRSTICRSAELTGAQWKRLPYHSTNVSDLCRRQRRTHYDNISMCSDDFILLIICAYCQH